MELQTLASYWTLAPCSAIARTSNSTPRFVSSSRLPGSIWQSIHLVEFQRFQRSRAVAAVFFSSDGSAAAARRRQRGGSRKKVDHPGGDVEVEILKFMEQSGRPNVFPSKEELIAAGHGDLVEAAIRKGGWLTVGWEFGRKSSSVGDLDRPKGKEVHLNGSGGQKDVLENGSSESRGKTEQHILRLNGHAMESFPSKEIVVDETRPAEACSPSDTPPSSSIRNGTRRRLMRKNIAELDKISSTGGPEINAEASHERWRRKRRKMADSIAAENSASVKDALSWIQDMVHKREQWILESRSRPSKQFAKSTTSESFPFDTATGRPDSSPVPGSERECSSGITRSSSRILSTGVPGLDSAKGKSLPVFSTVHSKTNRLPPSRSSLKGQQETQSPPSLTRTSSGKYTTEAPGLSKTGFNSSSVIDGSKSFNSRLRNLETKLLATRAALKSGRATLLKGEDKLMQVQMKTSEDLAQAADSLEFKENEIMQTRAELRKTRAQVTALQTKLAVELSEARKAADEKQVLLDRAENALKMLRLVRIVWPNAASHVLLTGSFDGWTNKIKMERSGAGVFVTALHLYPGRYEVKFIVDGTWRVDPCRPITYADGIENNVLMVS